MYGSSSMRLSRSRRTRTHCVSVAGIAATNAMVFLSSLGASRELPAQTITPRTVPVQMGQQFDIFPSDRAAMGRISIAIDDPLLDPFVNPAKAMRLKTGVL